MAAVGDRRVTKADIEAKLRQIKGEVDETTQAARSKVMVAGAVGVVALLGLAYVLGRRKGRKKTTVVEIRRV